MLPALLRSPQLVSLRLFRAGCGHATRAGAEADPFTAQLQRKTEQELEELVRRTAQDGAREVTVAELTAEVQDREEPQAAPATGEVGGPRGALKGAEPTRYGDWERGGRCYDF